MITTARTKWCLVTIGDYAVGKTSLIKGITDSAFSPQEVTTIGMDPFQTTLYHDDKPVKLVIWDTTVSFKGIEEQVVSCLRISESHCNELFRVA
jgi:GTPase SAR1 family protein